MKTLRALRWCVGCVGTLVLPATLLAATDPSGWVALFDGKTLNGWRASDGGDSWRIVGDALVLSGGPSSLYYVGDAERADFKNFEFTAEVLSRPHANSGVFFHTQFQATGFPTNGFKVQLANTAGVAGHSVIEKTGSLDGLRHVHKAVVRDDEWFTLHILVRGKRIQIRLNDTPVVDYVEPVNPVSDPQRPGRRLAHGTFGLQGSDPKGEVRFRNIVVRPLPGDLVENASGPVRFDAVDEQIVRLSGANYPLVDFHTHLKGGLTMNQVMGHMFQTGLNHGIAVNCGVGFAITNDAGIDDFLRSMAGQPVFVAMQAEGREWPTLFSPAAVARFDYVFTDGMTIFDHRGKRTRLWMKEEVEIPDRQVFMDHLVDTIVKLLNEEPIDIYVNPTFLPEVIARDYDVLWTPERMRRVIAAAAANGVAIEINSRYRLPSLAFLKLAKQAGLKFTLGTNNTDSNLGRDEYGLEMIKACGLTAEDFWMPKPDGQKPIQRKIASGQRRAN